MMSYILVGIHFEERDLTRDHGKAYGDDQARVPKLLPIGSRSVPQESSRTKAAQTR
jgi:protein-S-isoprenylcysteine O-methyltransferase Ste14